MNKKGTSPAIIIIATIAFTAAAIILWLSFFSRPDVFSQITKKGFIIGSDVQKSDDYTLNMNVINFLKSRTKNHETASELMRDIHDAWEKKDEARYNELNSELDEAAGNYVKTYEKKCVMLELTDYEGKYVWLNSIWVQDSIYCKMAGAGELASAAPIKVTIPTRDPEQGLTFGQRISKKTGY